MRLRLKRELVIAMLIPFFMSSLSFLFSKNGLNNYINKLVKSFLPLTNFSFCFFLIIIDILLGISSYLVYNSLIYQKYPSLLIYSLNLLIIFAWPIIFFNLEIRLYALIFLIFLDFVAFYMTICFYDINKLAAYLNIPYLIWLLYLTFFNFNVYLLNR